MVSVWYSDVREKCEEGHNGSEKFEKPEYFVNRELSWLKFDDRVLSEARDKSLPLFERLKFTSIVSSNLDEFYMVRVASLRTRFMPAMRNRYCRNGAKRAVEGD